MNPNFKLNLLTLSLLAITSIAHAEEEVSTQELDEIQVKGKHIAKEKKVFTEGQAKSSRERIYQSSEKHRYHRSEHARRFYPTRQGIGGIGGQYPWR